MNIKNQLDKTLKSYNKITTVDSYNGKVRDNYDLGDKLLMVTTDRVSAFDCVLGTIPFKGEILTQVAKFWFDKTKHIVPNHIIDYPDPQVILTKKAKVFPIEVIVRQYITGSLWREYSSGINGQYGFMLPEGLKENQKLESVILTPSTKEEYGKHDQPISRDKIVDGIIDEETYSKIENYSLKLFKEGQKWAESRGLILVDTKYEFGLSDGEIIVVDEIHTPDSSRYWIADEYEMRFKNNQKQLMLDKENIRQWLIDRGFKGEGTPPDLSDDIRVSLSERYIELYQKITGNNFRGEISNVEDRISKNLADNGFNFS